MRERGREGFPGGGIKKLRNLLIDKNKTKQVLIDAEMHRLLKIKAAEEKTTIRALIEGLLAELLGVPPLP